MVEQFPFKEWVGGSSPPGLTKKIPYLVQNFKINFYTKKKVKKINLTKISIGKDALKSITNLIYKLSHETKNINKKFFVADYPYLFVEKFKTLKLENYFI